MGHTGGATGEIRLNDVRVPRRHLLGAAAGLRRGPERLGPGRIFHCMRWLGQAERAFELMCARATTRFAHGSLLSGEGEIQRYVAESAAEIQAARLMSWTPRAPWTRAARRGSRSRSSSSGARACCTT